MCFGGRCRHRVTPTTTRTTEHDPASISDDSEDISRIATSTRSELVGGLVPSEGKLARALVELADTVVGEFDIVDLLTRLTDRCLDVLEVAAAGIMLAGPDGELRVVASSSEQMRMLELFELQSQEGPCLDCFRSGRAVINQQLTEADNRWSRFAPEARAAGFGTVHSFPMRLRGAVIGALNLFHNEPGHMRQADVDASQALADIATIAILQLRAAHEAQVLNQQLNTALESRIVIEQAKGIIASREGLDLDASFDRLRTHARNNNIRLTDAAKAITIGELAPSALDRPASRT